MIKLKGSGIICKGNVHDKFEAVPHSIHDYIELGLISGNDLIIYLKLYQLYSKEYGYAFPTLTQLEIMTNLSRDTINKSQKNLLAVGLIEVDKGYKGNNVYAVYKPLEQQDLYKQVPEKVKKLEQKRTEKSIRAQNDKQRKEAWKQNQQEQQQKIKTLQIAPKINVGDHSLPPEIDELMISKLSKF